jgi:hypothetical protein
MISSVDVAFLGPTATDQRSFIAVDRPATTGWSDVSAGLFHQVKVRFVIRWGCQTTGGVESSVGGDKGVERSTTRPRAGAGPVMGREPVSTELYRVYLQQQVLRALQGTSAANPVELDVLLATLRRGGCGCTTGWPGRDTDGLWTECQG